MNIVFFKDILYGKEAQSVYEGVKIETVYLIADEDKIVQFLGKERLSPEDEEIRQLKRENKRLLKESNILIKAVAIF